MTEEVKEILCTCGHAKTVHETFKGKLPCGQDSCECGNFKEGNTSTPNQGSTSGDWWADLVGAALDGAAEHVKKQIRKKL